LRPSSDSSTMSSQVSILSLSTWTTFSSQAKTNKSTSNKSRSSSNDCSTTVWLSMSTNTFSQHQNSIFSDITTALLESNHFQKKFKQFKTFRNPNLGNPCEDSIV